MLYFKFTTAATLFNLPCTFNVNYTVSFDYFVSHIILRYTARICKCMKVSTSKITKCCLKEKVYVANVCIYKFISLLEYTFVILQTLPSQIARIFYYLFKLLVT